MLFFLVVLLGGAEPLPIERCQIRKLQVGDQLTVETGERSYRFTVQDPRAGRVLARISSDGQTFGPPRTVYLLGATRGRPRSDEQMLVSMGVIEVGKRIELGLGTRANADRALTLPVRSISRQSAH